MRLTVNRYLKFDFYKYMTLDERINWKGMIKVGQFTDALFRMKKYIVLSVNDNPDYLFFTPLTFWAWRQFGWEPLILLSYRNKSGNDPLAYLEQAMMDHCPYQLFENAHRVEVKGYKSATVAQISRLYASSLVQGFIMTGDIDMLPLSDYWHPETFKKTVYGFDLTGKTEYPICYIAMNSTDWDGVMRIEHGDIEQLIARDLDAMPNAKSDDFYKWWGVDQQLITERLKPYNPVQILRGQYANGLAVGRVDRANWSLSHSQLIDAHLFHQLHHKNNQDKFEKVIELLYHVWPKENFDWFISYYLDYQKLTGHA